MPKIKALEDEVAELRGKLQGEAGLRAEVAAKDQALGAKLGVTSGEPAGLIDVAWGLLWAEYFHRNKMFQMVGLDARRPKTDRYGNKWSLHAVKDLTALSGMVEDLGFKLDEVTPADLILLHCFPNEGAYDIACQNLEKAQGVYRTSQRKVVEARQAVAEARERNRPDLADKAQRELDTHQEDMTRAATTFQECKAVIENAVQRFYLVPMEAFEKMANYGPPIVCQVATVVPQKKHQDLPEYRPPQAEVVM